MAAYELGILSHDLHIKSAAETAAEMFEVNFGCRHSVQPQTGMVVVYFAGREGIMDTPDEPPQVSQYMANMIP